MMGNELNLTKKKDQMKAKLALIKLIVDPNTVLQRLDIYPPENNLYNMYFTYYKKDDNSTTKK